MTQFKHVEMGHHAPQSVDHIPVIVMLRLFITIFLRVPDYQGIPGGREQHNLQLKHGC